MAISDQTNVLVVEDDLAIADMLVELIRRRLPSNVCRQRRGHGQAFASPFFRPYRA